MALKHTHLRKKAIQLRARNMTLDQIVEHLKLPKTTVYYWIKDIPISRTERQTEAQRKGTQAMQAKYAAIRETAYQQGLEEAPELLKDVTFRDFVVLYMAEGHKRDRNRVGFVNSDASMVVLAHRWIQKFTRGKINYRIQYHVDQDIAELKQYWAEMLNINAGIIKVMRKSNSGKLTGRNFRSVYGLLTIETDDTQFRARLQGWIDFIKAQW